jgi:hypothetical protein
MTATSRLAAVIAIAGLCVGWSAAGAEPLITQGIGTSNCGRLAGDLKPGEGLTNPVNLMAYAWAQGYISAANIALLETDAKHVDMSSLDETKVLTALLTYCKANPDKKPVGAIDELLRKTAKVKTKWDKGTVDWNQ